MNTNISLIAGEISSMFKPEHGESKANLEAVIITKLKPLADRISELENEGRRRGCVSWKNIYIHKEMIGREVFIAGQPMGYHPLSRFNPDLIDG